MSDIERGRKVFKSFWEWNRTFHNPIFKMTFEEFLNFYGNKTNIYLDGLGGAVREANLGDYQISQAMRSMALASNGSIPLNPIDMFKFLQDEATKVSWVGAIAYTAKESAKDIVKGAAQVGNSVIFTGKILSYLLPVIIIAYFFFNKELQKKVMGIFK